ncbi:MULTISPECIES: S8 family peptidase [Bacillus cereus group]|jgi:major intracellular serine protease|uniref:S8 family peptidase n=1 Tax=Bacillus cereus group TaxID=86661 RepID=UPI001F00D6CD|nr:MULTISPECIES: S8 family peptidase [Bacillus cereus group]MDA1811009.1 S8 family peptidase [Bacillus cereus]
MGLFWLVNERLVVSTNTGDVVPTGVNMIKAPMIWEKANYGKGVVIAILDTGCQIDHPDLAENIIGGRNFTSDYESDIANFADNNSHGTHIAGIIAAAKNGKGVIGVAPKASLLILKVVNGDGQTKYQSIIDAIYYAINWRGENGERVRVIMMSLGGRKDDVNLYNAVKTAISQQILIVCAAGNYGDGNFDTTEKIYPGIYNEVVQVGAVNSKKKIEYFSNTNNQIDLVAPGRDILSTTPRNGYKTLSGTSMAAPHVAGAAALIINIIEKEFKRTMTEAEIYAQIIKRTVSLGLAASAEGNGLLDLSK